MARVVVIELNFVLIYVFQIMHEYMIAYVEDMNYIKLNVL